MTATSAKTELQQRVLFDDDYKLHIEILENRLARERGEVIKLREELAYLRLALTYAWDSTKKNATLRANE